MSYKAVTEEPFLTSQVQALRGRARTHNTHTHTEIELKLPIRQFKKLRHLVPIFSTFKKTYFLTTFHQTTKHLYTIHK